MGAKRQFDEGEVLTQVTEHFWRHGYGATRVDDLSNVTGLTKTSLYNAFGNKEALFEKVMSFYHEQIVPPAFERVDMQKSMSRNVKVLLNFFFTNDQNPCLSYGCLVTNSIVELEGNNPKLYKKAVACFKEVRQRMHALFSEYAQSKRLKQGVAVDDLTDFFMTFFQGLRVRSRAPDSDESLARSIRTFLSVLKSYER